MVRITERILRGWADNIGIGSLILAEHDYRISHLLNMIYSEPDLREILVLKGGTAINKLHLSKTSRLSVDLDFNQIGTKEEVLNNVKLVREKLVKLSQQQDPNYQITYDRPYRQTTIHLKYVALTGTALQPIKLEISHVERIPILPTENKKLVLHDLGKSVEIKTYRIEELLATKLRALYDRMKGRDLYDLDAAHNLISDPDSLRKMFLYYFYCDRKVFNPKLYFEKVSNSQYEDDVTNFIRPDIQFNLNDAKASVIQKYRFLNDLNDSEKKFLNLAHYLLGEQLKKPIKSETAAIQYPFRTLFDRTTNFNQAILEIKTEEIKIYQKPIRRR